MNYGFVIDNRRCIGCHACSTACKSENEVPLGVYRTWVKTVEHGAYPDVTRSFQVSRCNHCANPPCVRICPTTAMYQRADGIVEFDNRNCIGCKSCIQACPYDAIYIDPESKTAAKCHYCAHRIDVGLEPACVVVCPVHAIIAGDMDNPKSEISRVAASASTTVRKPEQGTAPKVLYIDGDDIALHPTVFSERQPLMAAAEVVTEQGLSHRAARATNVQTARSGVEIREPQVQGLPRSGPLRIGGGKRADHMVQLAYNAQHEVPWHWPVPAYLVTKSIAAGVFVLIAAAHILGLSAAGGPVFVAAGAVGLVAALVTAGLLVFDLERPERFAYILLYPQWKSWLTRGAFLLIGFTTVAGLWWVVELATHLGWIAKSPSMTTAFAWLTLPLGVGAAIYTAFLFAQAEGRDLWQSPTVPIHLLVQAVAMGAATFALIDLFTGVPATLAAITRVALPVSLVASAVILLFGEVGIAPPSDTAARAAREMTHGRYRNVFWFGAIAVGHLIPGALLIAANDSVVAVGAAGAAAIVGLFYYEYAFVMAPQKVPNS